MIKKIDDIAVIKEFFLEDDLYAHVSDQNVSREDVTESMLDNKVWLGFFDGDKRLAGVIGLEPETPCTLEIHPYLRLDLKGSGVGKKMFNEFYEYFLKEAAPRFQKINAKVPSCNDDTYRFALKVGFIDEGIDRKSFLKDGDFLDRRCLGITRDEIKMVKA